MDFWFKSSLSFDFNENRKFRLSEKMKEANQDLLTNPYNLFFFWTPHKSIIKDYRGRKTNTLSDDIDYQQSNSQKYDIC